MLVAAFVCAAAVVVLPQQQQQGQVQLVPGSERPFAAAELVGLA